MKVLVSILLSIAALVARSQEIRCLALDENKEPFTGVKVLVYNDSISIQADTTDYDGKTLVKVPSSGCYDVMFATRGYDTFIVRDIQVPDSTRVPVNVTLSKHIPGGPNTQIRIYKSPLKDPLSNRHRLTKAEINILPGVEYCQLTPEPRPAIITRQQLQRNAGITVNDLVSYLPGMYQARRGDEPSYHGSGVGGVRYIVNGIWDDR